MAKSANIKKNFFYSSFLTTANHLFTFITYPYVSRVLGVEKIGTVNFIDSIVNYFIMLSMMGVAIVGIREVAKSKNKREDLNSIFSTLFILNSGFTVFALITLYIAYIMMPELHNHTHLMFLGAFKLIANMFLMDWFFKGIENFKIITIRTFTIRTLYVICTFIFIHSPEDYIIYFTMVTVSVVLNATVNCIYIQKFVSFTNKGLKLKKFTVSVLILGIYMFFGSFYSSFNTMILGLKCGDTEVGYFSTATKLYTIFLSLFSAFTAVMMPRMSSLLKAQLFEEYYHLFHKSIQLLFAFCMPLVILTTIQAHNIIPLIAGNGYEGAIVPMMVCMPLLLVIGYSQILINQGLMPLGKDKAILVSSIVGGTIACIMCFLIIQPLGSIGSAILWVLSELAVNITAGFFVFKYIHIKIPIKYMTSAFFYHIPLLLILLITKDITSFVIVDLAIASSITFIYCFTLQCFIIKDETILSLFRLKKK